MIPVLYPVDQRVFDTNGIGRLSDTISCKCAEVLNGTYEIELDIPVDGNHVSEMSVNCIILAKPNYEDDPQPFRIYSMEENIDGLVKVKAAHITYDVSGIPILPFTASNLTDTVNYINTNHVLTKDTEFVLETDFEADGEFKIDTPSPFRSVLGSGDSTLIGVYGGDYHYDNFTINLVSSRGIMKGICFRYRKNITEFEEEINSENMYSAVLGYWKKAGSNGNGDIIVYSNLINVSDSLPYDRIYILDTSEMIQTEEDANASILQVTECVEKYITDNNLRTPEYNMKIEYAEDDKIIKVCLGDMVGVLLPEYNVRSIARCRKVVFDCLLERNESIEIGSVSAGITEDLATVI